MPWAGTPTTSPNSIPLRRLPPSASAQPVISACGQGPAPPAPPGKPFNLELAHGDLLLMEPPTQLWWQHSLPRRLRLQQERLNLTFRVVRADR